MTIFDSNVWIAFLHESDSQRKKAEKIFRDQKESVFVPEYVIVEVTSVLLQKAGKERANTFLEMVMHSNDVEVLFANEEFFLEVVKFVKKRPEKKLSFVDFSLLHLSASYELITFDKNLQKAVRLVPLQLNYLPPR